MSKRRFFLIPLLLIVLLFPGVRLEVSAEEDSAYRIVLEDDADLLQPGEELQLVEKMSPVAQYANVAFHSVKEHSYGVVEDYAEAYLARTFGRGQNATVFIIDMRLRKVCIYSDGAAYRTITKGRANSITDNVYSFASQKRYLACAEEVFSEILTIMEGGRIAEPMKVASNALFAVALALLLMFIIVMSVTALKKPSAAEWQTVAYTTFEGGEPRVTHTGTTRRYSPPSSSSGGGGGHSGGGGGGGHSGGGGSHSF